MTRDQLTDDLLLERILTRDPLTNDSLLGIRLLAEMVRSSPTPGQEYLRVLNLRTRIWKEKAQKLFKARGAGHPHTCKRTKQREAKTDPA